MLPKSFTLHSCLVDVVKETDFPVDGVKGKTEPDSKMVETVY